MRNRLVIYGIIQTLMMVLPVSYTHLVQLKAQAGKKYCAAATEFNAKHGGKPWKYLLIPHDVVKEGVFFDWLAKQFEV